MQGEAGTVGDMPALSYAFPADVVRAAEQPLINAQQEPDELMRSAAYVVAVAAQTMLRSQPTRPGAESVLLLVGGGGNGGDALYAGASLAEFGYPVHAVLLDAQARVHERAHESFLAAGGRVLEGFPGRDLNSYRLIIDGVLGLGGEGGLRESLAHTLLPLRRAYAPVLAVDVPSGVEADSGALPEPFETDLQERVPAHIDADVTVTFGGLRYAHCLTAACGEVILADIEAGGTSLSSQLAQQQSTGKIPQVFAVRAIPYRRDYEWPATFVSPQPEDITAVEPGPADDKYSGGVVGVCAGSAQYPGAAILSTHAAVRATSSMVRYVGTQADEVVRAFPEVVATTTLEDAGRVQAWVFGPGRGVDDGAAAELADLLDEEAALLIDADGITLLAERPELRAALIERTGSTVLTPHAGEFRRLADAVPGDVPDPAQDPIGAVTAMVRELRCAVLLKGRFTVIARPAGELVSVSTVDAGTSWAATAGSGDVLSGLLGARMAHSSVVASDEMPQYSEDEEFHPGLYSLADGVQIHAVATWLSAQTPDGAAPTSASRIAKYVPRATARLSALG